jgi:histidinol-phosphatase (PHP family)
MSDSAEPLYFDSHMHTPLCRHAYGHPSEYAEFGQRRGLRGIIVTCHSPMPDRFSHSVRMEPSEFDDYVKLVQEGADRAAEGFEVRLGLESDFFPGMEEWLSDLHGQADFHFILGSVHWHIPEYVESYWFGDVNEFRRQYFEHLAESAETGLFDCLSHPDLVKNASAGDWMFEEIRPVIVEALDRIAATGVAMELNTSGIYKAVPEMNPGLAMLRLMKKRDIPVVLGSDSHQPERVGDGFVRALDALERAGYDEVSFFEERRRHDLPIADVRESLRNVEMEFV